MIAFEDYTNKCINKPVSKQCQPSKSLPSLKMPPYKNLFVICPWTHTHQGALKWLSQLVTRSQKGCYIDSSGTCLFLLSNFENNSEVRSNQLLLIISKNESGISLIEDIEKWGLSLPCVWGALDALGQAENTLNLIHVKNVKRLIIGILFIIK